MWYRRLRDKAKKNLPETPLVQRLITEGLTDEMISLFGNGLLYIMS